MNFSSVFDPEAVHQQLFDSLKVHPTQVENTLKKPKQSLSDATILLSPAAESYLEPMAIAAQQLTLQRFGHTMQLFMPLYISNVCYNSCAYCGFSIENKYDRVILTPEDVLKEATLLKEKGIDHILLLTGEAPGKVDLNEIGAAVAQLKPLFSSVGIEVQPFDQKGYETLIQKGADSLTLYQETYHPDSYEKYHTRGKKKHFKARLAAMDEGGKAGFYRLNLGALLGLYDWRYEALALIQHLSYIQKKYWRSKLSVSFPRITPEFGGFTPEFDVPDKALVQLITTFRLLFPDLGITLSTREPAGLRDHLLKLGVTQMSAESSTAPGGYEGTDAEEQFEISDKRSVSEIKGLLTKNGFEAVLKDWENVT